MFKVGDLIDALDEEYIWWPAKIAEIISDWEIKVKWMHFTNANSFSKISVPIQVRYNVDHWNIRVPAKKPEIPQKRQRSKHEKLDYTACFRSRLDQVNITYFKIN